MISEMQQAFQLLVLQIIRFSQSIHPFQIMYASNKLINSSRIFDSAELASRFLSQKDYMALKDQKWDLSFPPIMITFFNDIPMRLY